MKKRTLQEELERIHGITYGEGSLKEGFLDFLLGKTKDSGIEKKVDEPDKADLVSSDVQDFYDTIQKSIENGGLKEQCPVAMPNEAISNIYLQYIPVSFN